MMEWMIVISYLLTNGPRLILGLYLVAKLMDAELDKKAISLSILGSCLITALHAMGLPVISIAAVEVAMLMAITWYYLREQLRICLFLIFFYEVAVGLWEFLISAGMSLLFHSEKFMDAKATEYLISIWLMRLLMMAVTALFIRQQKKEENKAVRLASIIAILGLFGVIGLSFHLLCSAQRLKDGEFCGKLSLQPPSGVVVGVVVYLCGWTPLPIFMCKQAVTAALNLDISPLSASLPIICK